MAVSGAVAPAASTGPRHRHHLRQSKVENLGVSALGDKDIRGLDVAVDNTLRVRGIERVGNLDGQTEQNIGFHGPAGDAMLQRYAVEKLHCEKGMAILLPDFVDGADIRMVERRSRPRLALEPRQGLRVFDHLIGKELQGDKAVEGYIFRLVNHAHATAPELLENAVV